MSAHTPGPWILSACSRHGFVIWAESGDESVVQTVDDYGRIGPIDSESNARLISAAPELLDALERGLPSIEHCYHTNDDPTGALWDAVVRARAAIAKAKGETP